MKNVKHLLIFLSLILGLIYTSCVSSKKYVATDARADKLQQENTDTKNQLDACNLQVTNLKEENNSLQNENDSERNDLKVLTAESNLTIAEQAKRLKNLQNVIQTQKNVMTMVKNAIADAIDEL